MKKYFFLVFALSSFILQGQPVIQFVYTSDVHFGITRAQFRGEANAPSLTVNQAMVKQIKTLPGIQFIVITGDIANRAEPPYQSAAASWAQFTDTYIKGLNIPLYLVAGNHDASNAVGYYRPMAPLKDASSMAGIYNYMFHPATPKTAETFDYKKDKIHYSKDIGGVHFMFIQIWADSAERIWMEKDLKTVAATTPVIMFQHDPPEGDTKHFTNPKGTHDINATDKFENILEENYNENVQAAFTDFLKHHSNIKAYFHGHSNGNEFYTYTGTDHSLHLPVFRVDSPMKGKPSATDETKLSFQVVSIDMKTKKMTVSECLWNNEPVKWGSTITIPL